MVRSSVGITEAQVEEQLVDGAAPILMFAGPRETVTLSGTVTNVSSAGNVFNVYADIRGASVYQAVGPDYEIEVPVGQAFNLTVLEFTGGTNPSRGFMQDLIAVNVVASDALDADATLDVDLSEPLAFVNVEGSFPTPEAGHQLETTGSAYYISGVESNGSISYNGFPENIGIFDDPALFEYQGVYWVVPGATNPRTFLRVSTGSLLTTVTIDGYADGPQDAAFLDPAIVETPAFGVMHPISEPVVITTLHPEALVFMTVSDEDGMGRWFLGAPAGTTEFTIPELPSGVSESALLTDGPLSGRVQVCDYEGEGADGFCRRQAYGRVFDFER